MSVRVRMAPSPTGALHVGGVRTALFNWLFARHVGGEFRLRIENTDTNREVEDAVEQIRDSLKWLGLDWDGEVTFQLDRAGDCGEVARRLVDEGKAYEDEGAIRFRMPDDGVTAWEDVVKGPIEFPNAQLEDLVLVRSDGRPTYNFASPLEDVWDEITHVIRGDDHISNTPKQINVIRALGADLPVYAHVPNVLGPDGKKLSKRHGATGVDELRAEGYVAPALLNFLALLGWSYDDKTTVMSRDELVERFTLERVTKSPAVFDYEKLNWLNGMYLRALSLDAYADELVGWLEGDGYEWDVGRVRELRRSSRRRSSYSPSFPRSRASSSVPSRSIRLRSTDLPTSSHRLPTWFRGSSRGRPRRSKRELRGLADARGLKPRDAFQPIRIAVTGSKVSPGLFESIELLGREESVARLSAFA